MPRPRRTRIPTAKKVLPLTDAAILNAKSQAKAHKLSDGLGLYVEILPAGGKSWRFKYRFAGQEKRLVFGLWPDVSLKQARQRRDDARAMVADGVDPGEKRKQDTAALAEAQAVQAATFELVAREWHAAQVRTWSEGHAIKVLSTMEQHLFPVFGSEPISLLRAPAILPVLRAVEAKGINYTAKRLRQYCEAVFTYAIATGRSERNVGADLRGALAPCKVTNRPAIVEPKAVGKLLRAIDGYEGSPVTLAAPQAGSAGFRAPWRTAASRMVGNRPGRGTRPAMAHSCRENEDADGAYSASVAASRRDHHRPSPPDRGRALPVPLQPGQRALHVKHDHQCRPASSGL